MAISFREFPWYIHVLIYVALAVVLVLAGEFLPFSPVQQTRANLDRLNQEHQKLTQEVTALRVYERRYSEFKLEMEALQKQLDTLKTIVPEDKELDEFIRLLQGAASASNVQVRRLTAMPLSPRDYHFEMPFEVQVDGPYYSILEFFTRLSRLSRIINVGDVTFSGLGDVKSAKYPVRPGTTVTGTFIATTFFTKAAEEPVSKAPARQPSKR
ncbi:MAG: hypothetical protein DMG28_02530 [Acidobacteria bacterium]|nr:MAG: hypothetical protein DMG29_09775 [Acidobacteriota bacterium]PYU35514.1 MAG: hypothetical protein DMG28_02530 [Acidobacteriota bacterium]